MSTGEKYLSAAYLVLLVLLLVYVAIIAAKLARLEREVAELTDAAGARRRVEETGVGGQADEGDYVSADAQEAGTRTVRG